MNSGGPGVREHLQKSILLSQPAWQWRAAMPHAGTQLGCCPHAGSCEELTLAAALRLPRA